MLGIPHFFTKMFSNMSWQVLISGFICIHGGPLFLLGIFLDNFRGLHNFLLIIYNRANAS